MTLNDEIDDSILTPYSMYNNIRRYYYWYFVL